MVDLQSAPTDVELMREVAEGDGPALELLYDRYAHILFPLARRILKDHQEAKDALQDVFVQVWQSARSYDPARGSTLTWLVTLTRSRALDRLRALRRRGWPSPETECAEPAAASDPLAEAILNEQRRRVHQALDAIPVEQQRAIELAYFEGLTQTEIADRLGEPLGTIKTRIRLGMRKLRELLSEETKPRTIQDWLPAYTDGGWRMADGGLRIDKFTSINRFSVNEARDHLIDRLTAGVRRGAPSL